jgi:hypothetical protein
MQSRKSGSREAGINKEVWVHDFQARPRPLPYPSTLLNDGHLFDQHGVQRVRRSVFARYGGLNP